MHSGDPLISLGEGRDVLLSAIRVSPDSRAFYLARLHGSITRPICRCVSQGVPMGVGRRTAGLPRPYHYLYPLHRSDGALHGPLCPNRFSPSPPSHHPVDGPLPPSSPGAPSTPIPVSSPPTASSNVPGDLPTSRLLLDLLLAESGLNDWRPTYDGHRTYGKVRHRLLAASVDLATRQDGGFPHRLFVPPVFAIAHRIALEQDFHSFIAPRQDSTIPRFVVGRIRNVEWREGAWSAPLLYLSETNERFWLNEIPDLVPLPFEPATWLAAMEIRPSTRAKSGFTVVGAAATLVTSQAIPVPSQAHARLAEKLSSTGASFVASLLGDPSTAWAYPDLILASPEGVPSRLAPVEASLPPQANSPGRSPG